MAGAKRRADIARIVRSGDHQVVERPQAYAFDASEVSVRRDGNAVILEPVEDEWDRLRKLADTFDAQTLDRMLAAIEEEVPQQERPELDELPCAA